MLCVFSALACSRCSRPETSTWRARVRGVMEEGEPRKPSDPREAGKTGVPGIEAGEPGAEVTEEEEDEATRELATRSRCAGRACSRGALGAFVPPPAAAPAEPFTPGRGVAAAVAAAVPSKIAMGSTPSVKDVSRSMGSYTAAFGDAP